VGVLRFCYFSVLERLLQWAPHPKLRAHLLRLAGATVGPDARVECVQFTGIATGFHGLTLGAGAFVGGGCVIDLTDRVTIGDRAAVSPGCVLVTHADPGSMTGNQLSARYPRKTAPIVIAEDAWIGAQATILCGVIVGAAAVVGAGAVVLRDVPAGTIALGVPASVRAWPADRFILPPARSRTAVG
jgi:acetyltransferase-like isoleucine patch superfamily enzyme